MISLICSIVLLIIGYFTYGKFVDKVFKPTDERTPAYKSYDGVDFVPLKLWKAFLIQLLNIAGTGPIFGALMGAVFGPVVYLWIIFGCILGGAVHDYTTGMISLRNNGSSIAEMSGIYLGTTIKWLMRIFSLVLLILVGAVFVTSPAALFVYIFPNFLNINFWVILILIYFFLATLIPIDKLIGKLYPIFGLIILLMTVTVLLGIVFQCNISMPEITLQNMHPNGLSIWPFMFITVACGAISGFHVTQSPMISKCLQTEKHGRKVFYGAMVTEGIIALAWAAAGVSFYEGTHGLHEALNNLGQSGVVYDISINLLGPVGGILAVVGVGICPITSGDTAFRSARLILSEITNIKQKKIKNRLLLSMPLLLFGGLLTQINFNYLWRYFSWSNQTLAMLALGVATAYFLKEKKNKFISLITMLPCSFMGAVTFTYIMMADEGLQLHSDIAFPLGIMFGLFSLVLYIFQLVDKIRRQKQKAKCVLI